MYPCTIIKLPKKPYDPPYDVPKACAPAPMEEGKCLATLETILPTALAWLGRKSIDKRLTEAKLILKFFKCFFWGGCTFQGREMEPTQTKMKV